MCSGSKRQPFTRACARGAAIEPFCRAGSRCKSTVALGRPLLALSVSVVALWSCPAKQEAFEQAAGNVVKAAGRQGSVLPRRSVLCVPRRAAGCGSHYLASRRGSLLLPHLQAFPSVPALAFSSRWVFGLLPQLH